jgi:LysM repeat protein
MDCMERARRFSLQEARLTVLALAAVGLACAGHRAPGAEPSGSRATGAVPSAPAPSARWNGTYVVRAGDTLAEVSHCRGVSVASLAAANGIRDPDRITAGLRLRVPDTDRCKPADVEAASPAGDAPLTEAREPAETPIGAAPCPTAVCPDYVSLEETSDHGRRLLDVASGRYRSADFEQALTLAESATALLAPYAGHDEIDRLRGRAHYLAALSALGLERRDDAQASLRRALALDPALASEPESQSPRVAELVREVAAPAPP